MAERFFFGFTEVSGYNNALVDALNRKNIIADFFELQPHPFKYSRQKHGSKYFLVLTWLYGIFFCKSSTANNALKYIYKIFFALMMLPFFIWTLFRYDVFVFAFGQSFFKLFDLPILKFFGKKIICIFYGSDSRPLYLDGMELSLKDLDVEKIVKDIAAQKKKIKFIDRFADIAIDHALSGHFHEKKFISWLCIGIPTNFLDVQSNAVKKVKEKNDGAIRILHAPSLPEVKGSQLIRETIQRLIARGFEIVYTELKNVPNSEVINSLMNSDLVIDQLYSDSPMATFATEAAFCSIPSVVGGYGWESLNRAYLNKIELPPSFLTSPENLELTLEQLMTNQALIKNKGDQARQFVKANWSADKIAEKFLTLVSGIIPEDWWFDPKKIDYIYGSGVTKEVLLCKLKTIIAKKGIKVLQLADKPMLEESILQFVNSAEKLDKC